jgi:hypothetical protein
LLDAISITVGSHDEELNIQGSKGEFGGEGNTGSISIDVDCLFTLDLGSRRRSSGAWSEALWIMAGEPTVPRTLQEVVGNGEKESKRK